MKTLIGCASNDSFGPSEAAIGAQFAGMRLNSSMDHSPTDDSGAVSRGLVLYRNANVEDSSAHPVYGGWAGVANGQADAWLNQLAIWVNANFTAERPFFYSPHHEQRMANSQQCGVGCNGDADDYIAQFRHVTNFMRNRCNDKVRMCFVPGIGQYKRDDDTAGATILDPGPDYVDVYGCDAYQLGKTFEEQSIHLVAEFAAKRDRPWMIGEFGVDTGLYLEKAINLFRSSGNCLMVLTDSASVNPSTTATWNLLVDDPDFAFKDDDWSFGGTVTPPPTVIVPMVVGLDLAEAQRTLEAVGLAVSATDTTGTVVGQLPTAGTVAPFGAIVLLTVGVDSVPPVFGHDHKFVTKDGVKIGLPCPLVRDAIATAAWLNANQDLL